jgi:hypothetical protein
MAPCTQFTPVVKAPKKDINFVLASLNAAKKGNFFIGVVVGNLGVQTSFIKLKKMLVLKDQYWPSWSAF